MAKKQRLDMPESRRKFSNREVNQWSLRSNGMKNVEGLNSEVVELKERTSGA